MRLHRIVLRAKSFQCELPSSEPTLRHDEKLCEASPLALPIQNDLRSRRLNSNFTLQEPIPNFKLLSPFQHLSGHQKGMAMGTQPHFSFSSKQNCRLCMAPGRQEMEIVDVNVHKSERGSPPASRVRTRAVAAACQETLGTTWAQTKPAEPPHFWPDLERRTPSRGAAWRWQCSERW